MKYRFAVKFGTLSNIYLCMLQGWSARVYAQQGYRRVLGSSPREGLRQASWIRIIVLMHAKHSRWDVYTLCPGSSDPPEKIFNIFASENEVYTIYNYYDTLG